LNAGYYWAPHLEVPLGPGQDSFVGVQDPQVPSLGPVAAVVRDQQIAQAAGACASWFPGAFSSFASYVVVVAGGPPS